MSKICIKCGNILSNEALFCARCGTPLSQNMNHRQINQGKQPMNSQWNYQNQQEINHNQWNHSNWQGMNNQGGRQKAIHINIHQIKNNLMIKSRKLLSGRNKKRVWIGIGIAAILIVVFVNFVLGRTPSDRRLKEQFPMDLLTYKYDNEVKTSEIKSFKVERRQSGRDYDTAYCRVELEDELMTRVLYVTMSSQKYTRGGWNVEYWSLYQTGEVIPKTSPEDIVIDKVKAHLYYYTVSVTNVQETKNNDGSYTYIMNMGGEYVSGFYSATFKLENLSEESAESLNEVEFPMRYGWSITSDDKSNLKEK